MSLGTLYITPALRRVAPISLIKELSLDVKIVNILEQTPPEYTKHFPLKKIPAFIGSNGFAIHEVHAIVYYFINISKKPTKLYGSTLEETTNVIKWFSYANTDLWNSLRSVIFPLTHRLPYTKEGVEAAAKDSVRFVSVLENHLAQNEYLAADYVTVADYHTAAVVERAFSTIWGKEFIAEHPGIHKWFDRLIHQKPLNEIYSTPYAYRETPIEYVPKN